MLRVGRSDLEATLRFVAKLGDVAADDPTDPLRDVDCPYPAAVLTGIQELVPCAAVAYQDVNLESRRFDVLTWVGPDDDVDGGEDDEADEALYWQVGPCPISLYRDRTGALEAVRNSDVSEAQQYRQSAIFREYFRPAGMGHMLDLGLPAGSRRHRSVLLFRELGAGDFSDRDRSVLELLRPHLLSFETNEELRRQLVDALARTRIDSAPIGRAGLTAREREIVLLVAQGMTNAQIAAELWVAHSTVKKHLENVYEKLGVGRRAAAVQLLQGVN